MIMSIVMKALAEFYQFGDSRLCREMDSTSLLADRGLAAVE